MTLHITHPAVNQIVDEVLKVAKVEMEGVISSSRKRENVQARQLIAFYVRQYTDMCYREIGERLGGRDHTTIMACIDRLNALCESGDKQMCDLVKKMNRRFRDMTEEQQIIK
ncbi:MAG TPA: helix-turn-helix domain-containing protein [Niabella sp.]|nr:helix-turn-helix domain-containing protein [Niabella sp.]